ncbi:cytochrome P450 [Nocardia kruczakiae]|uniref:Cytochrome P450 n=1 Tax=Nocardia kruczakiae TaxID=261477 RepID=A0ABU1XA61_9NOCA|nr:cytochrome P450 [Nocardia kruczakiae]MDR7166961.1 cytochrome P450 [Nocardia kruczakiae]
MPTSPQTPGPVRYGSPGDSSGPRIPLYTEEFAADPHRIYRQARERFGALVPIDLAPGVPATLVIDYQVARRILNDPDHFPADPRHWQRQIPADCPVLPLMEWRPNAFRSAGAEHARYRTPTVAALHEVEMFALHHTVERIAVPLIDAFCTTGTAEIITEYAYPLTFQVVNTLLGCPADIGRRAADAFTAIFDGAETDEADALLVAALADLIALRRKEPGNDVTSRLLRHPVQLDQDEMIAQLFSFYGAGIEPLHNLIVNTVRTLLTEDRFAGGLLGGSMTTRAAVDEVLFTDPPLANMCTTFPRQAVLIDGVWLPAHQPVVISMAACNNDPAVAVGEYVDNSSHLSWSVGPHACPARSVAYLVAQDAVDQLLDALPEMRLAVPAAELTWRRGPFHRALTALPVVFPPSPPLSIG